MNLSSERLATLIHRNLPKILATHLRELNNNYITITEVRVTKDLSFATVFYTLLENTKEERDNLNHLLGRFKGEIKRDLAKDLKNNRKIPELIFTYDESLNYGNKIDKLLRDIKKDEEK